MRELKYINQKAPIPWFLQSDNDSNTLVIAFSSATDNFEWYNSLEAYSLENSFKRFYVADMWKVWWHGVYKGIEDFGPLVLRDYLSEKIKDQGIKRIATIGASRGAYGAIMFGCLLNADLVLAFSPQTNIDKKLDKKYAINERIEILKKEVPNFKVDSEFVDLKNILKNNIQNKTIYKIFYGAANDYDDKHAKNLSEFNNVSLHTVDSESHKVSKNFLKNGTIKKLIEDFVKEI